MVGTKRWLRQEPNIDLLPITNFGYSPRDPIESLAYCYVSGGAEADCPCSYKSNLHPGASFRPSGQSNLNILLDFVRVNFQYASPMACRHFLMFWFFFFLITRLDLILIMCF